MSSHTTHLRSDRRGISLLEVLVSIGVLSIGLLGVLALMPAASNQAKIGAQQDAASILARRAFREMNVRWQNNDAIGGAGGDPFFLVDPLGGILKPQLYPTLAINQIVNVTGPGANGYPASTTVRSANRALLRRVPFVDADFDNAPDPLPNVAINEIFRSKDDLLFDDVTSRENPAPNPPQQVALTDSTGLPVKRFASGNLSWFSTVVARNTGFSTVSVAIADKRSGEEFVAEINNNNGTIQGGVLTSGGIGEIQIPLANATQDAWDNVKSGHWILIAAADNNDASFGTAEWYRVQANGTADLNNDGTDDHRVYSVAGPHWDQSFIDTLPFNANDRKTYAILIPNVIAVHSRSLPVN